MNAADTSASSAIADCTPLTVVSRSRTTAEIDTFISDVSTTSTNIAIASRRPSRRFATSPWLGLARVRAMALAGGRHGCRHASRTQADPVVPRPSGGDARDVRAERHRYGLL